MTGAPAIEVDRDRLVETASRMIDTPSFTGSEQPMAELMVELLDGLGVPRRELGVVTDAHRAAAIDQHGQVRLALVAAERVAQGRLEEHKHQGDDRARPQGHQDRHAGRAQVREHGRVEHADGNGHVDGDGQQELQGRRNELKHPNGRVGQPPGGGGKTEQGDC